MRVTPEQQLVLIYQRAAAKLRRDIARALATDAIGTAIYRQRQLTAVLLQLRHLDAVTPALAAAAAEQFFLAGARAVDLAAGVTGQAGFAFQGGHRQAIGVLAQNMTSRVAGATRLVGRRTDDAFRRVALERVAIGLAAGDTRRDVSRALERQLIEEGVTDALTGFVDRRKRRWQLDHYTEMVARTTTREAVSAGTEARMRQTGQRLVTISTHPGACDICQPFDGRTFALPGLRVPGYVTIGRLPPFHPFCLHVAAPAGDEDGFIAALQSLTVTA